MLKEVRMVGAVRDRLEMALGGERQVNQNRPRIRVLASGSCVGAKTRTAAKRRANVRHVRMRYLHWPA